MHAHMRTHTKVSDLFCAVILLGSSGSMRHEQCQGGLEVEVVCVHV